MENSRIRKLTAADNTEVMAFLCRESAINLFIIGDIETVGYDSEIQEVWAEFHDDGIRAVLLRYFHFYLMYAPGACDADGFAAIIRSDSGFEMLSGREGAVEALAERLSLGDGKRLYFAELRDAELLGEADSTAVQRAVLDDVDDIYELRCSIAEFRTTPSARDSLRQGLERGSARTYYYRQDGRMVAAASTSAENSMSAMIVGVCTRPEYRRRGYASLCMNTLCRDMLAAGKFLCLFYDNPAAGKIYKRIGFRDIGIWKMYYAHTASAQQ